MKKEIVDYFFEIFEKGNIPQIFSEITTHGEHQSIQNPEYEDRSDTVYSFFFIPDYLKPVYNTAKLNTKTISQFFKGYAILLDGFASADAYVKARFRSNAKGIRRRVKRLETCFDISYKTFYGEIQREEYDALLDALEKMLVRRFEQRNDVSQSLKQWDRYKKMYFSLINEKKASLFVVYEKNTPIVVSLNHHFHGRLFSAISSYDIDFGKFSLGSVEIFKKLDWCIANDHLSYEMGMGDLSYKREWCNHIYQFEQQILYPKKSLSGWLTATTEYLKASVKEFVFKIAYVRYKNFKAKRKKEHPIQERSFETHSIEELKTFETYQEIDYNQDEHLYLRRNVFDFLYTSIEHVDQVKVIQVPEEKDSFYICGASKMQKIIFAD